MLPDGPLEGTRYRLSTQPAHRALFAEFDSGRWRRHVVIGPSQSGKTLGAFLVPLLYHLFEIVETVVCAVPDLAMVADIWQERILPAIERTRYRDQLPLSGEGARGGNVESSVRFRRGQTLRFMTGGKSDRSVASFTSRVLVATEAESLERQIAGSREANRLAQLEARTRAFANSRTYLECTVTTEDGLIYSEFLRGSAGELAMPCPHCGEHVTPRRRHLVGWKEAADEFEAAQASIHCPNCAAAWTEAERRQANQAVRVVHRGQSIDREGNVTGPLPPTNTLGFRWSAANNLLLPISETAVAEWLAPRAADPDQAERDIAQFRWAEPTKTVAVSLSDQRIIERAVAPGKGIVPAWAIRLTEGWDVGKRWLHWTVTAWGEGARSHIIDYGASSVPSDDMAEEIAIMGALRERRDMSEAGWMREDGSIVRPDLTVIDAGNWQDTICAFAAESGEAYVASKGQGVTQYGSGRYRERKTTSSTVHLVGVGYHLATLADGRGSLLEFDADAWKSWLHARLAVPVSAPGAMTLYQVPRPQEHLTLARHLGSEQKVEEYSPRRGLVSRWDHVRGANHLLDSTTLSCVASHVVGIRVVESRNEPSAEPARAEPAPKGAITMPDGRPFLITQRA